MFQVCCKDLWYLEVDVPPAPGRVSLVKAATHSLEINWTGWPSIQNYVLQVQKYDFPQTASTPKQVPGHPTAIPALVATPKLAQAMAPPLASTTTPGTSAATPKSPLQLGTPIINTPKIGNPLVRGNGNKLKILFSDYNLVCSTYKSP